MPRAHNCRSAKYTQSDFGFPKTIIRIKEGVVRKNIQINFRVEFRCILESVTNITQILDSQVFFVEVEKFVE